MQRLINLTENGMYVIHTRKLTDRYENNYLYDDNCLYESIVFLSNRDGSANVDRSVETKRYKSEDTAYAGHLNLWRHYSSKI
jgi:hypothetical protein